jgi:hypothetical protein
MRFLCLRVLIAITTVERRHVGVVRQVGRVSGGDLRREHPGDHEGTGGVGREKLPGARTGMLDHLVGDTKGWRTVSADGVFLARTRTGRGHERGGGIKVETPEGGQL